jgi:hypothetical protein
VHPDVAEVVAKPRFHIGSHILVKRLTAARIDHLVHRRQLLVAERGRDALIADRTLQIEEAVRADDIPAARYGRLCRQSRIQAVGARRFRPQGRGPVVVVIVCAHGETSRIRPTI